MIKALLVFAACSGFLSVALGAFGAHGLKGRLTENLMSAFDTAVQYQALHSLAILACCLLALHFGRGLLFQYAGIGFALGIVLFSGSLYGLALGGPKLLGPVTPLGGLCLLLGWAMLVVAIVKHAE